jgi:hypothetical protein
MSTEEESYVESDKCCIVVIRETMTSVVRCDNSDITGQVNTFLYPLSQFSPNSCFDRISS